MFIMNKHRFVCSRVGDLVSVNVLVTMLEGDRVQTYTWLPALHNVNRIFQVHFTWMCLAWLHVLTKIGVLTLMGKTCPIREQSGNLKDILLIIYLLGF